MPKAKKTAPKKQKLTPEQRSQVAKDRWAKRKAPASEPISSPETIIHTVTTNEPITTPSAVTISYLPSEAMSGEPVTTEPFRPTPSIVPVPYEPAYSVPAPQLAPVAPKKPKRYTGPKEFSVALKAAENRLAKAITERAEYAGKLAAVNAEIPSLMQIIQALRGSSIPVNAPVLHDAFGGFPGPQPSGVPYNPGQAAMQAAGIPPPVSRAQGGAVQFGPEVVGALEGPEDDDPDKFLTGPNAGGGWIGA